jgi:hypothetical protein
MLTTTPWTFGVGEGVRLTARHHHHLLAERVPGQKLHDASARVPAAPSTTAEYCAFVTPFIAPVPCSFFPPDLFE